MKNPLILFFTLIIVATIETFGQPLKDTVVDTDGNVYHTVKIGTQVWMVKNLNTTHYSNGEPIPLFSNDDGISQWGDLKTGVYSNYNNNDSIASVYGRLYNYKAIIDKREICPKGWRIPSVKDWVEMEKYLALDSTKMKLIAEEFAKSEKGTYSDVLDKIDQQGDLEGLEMWAFFFGAEEIGKKANSQLKEQGSSHWLYKNQDATNASYFNALPAGYRSFSGSFSGLGYYAYWWSSTERKDKELNDPSIYIYTITNNENGDWYRENNGIYFGDIGCGFSVRCIKD